MALGDSYADIIDLKNRLGIDVGDTSEDAELNSALAAASRGVEGFCRRQFNQTTTATARKYEPEHRSLTFVADFHTTTDLVVKTGTGGTFDTTWTSGDFELEPLNGVVDGEEGWPFWKVRAVESVRFPIVGRASVEVTAQWGWGAVPAPVHEATLIAAEEIFKLKDAPFGATGIGDLGIIRVRENQKVAAMLTRYQRNSVKVGWT